MADYPTSIFAPASKNNGDVIQAAHVNNLQDEVIAVETGLKNGLQHALTVSTGGLTVSTGNTVLGQNLSVAGNSTLAGLVVSSNASVSGNLQVTGTSTFTGAVTFTVPPSGLVSVPRIRLGITADQNLAALGFTGISWPVESYDSHNMHSTAANSSRITFVDSSGIYHIGCSVDITNASSGAYRVMILLGDSTASMVAANGFFSNVAPTFNSPLAASGDMQIADTTVYATVRVYNGAATTNSVTSTGSFVTAFWAHKVSS